MKQESSILFPGLQDSENEDEMKELEEELLINQNFDSKSSNNINNNSQEISKSNSSIVTPQSNYFKLNKIDKYLIKEDKELQE